MTVTQLRPTSTDRNANVNTTGSASAFSVLDDSPATDTTIAQGASTGSYVYLGFPDGSPAPVGDQRFRAVRAQVRLSHDGLDVGHVETASIYFRDNVTGSQKLVWDFGTATVYAPGSFATLVGPYIYSNAGNQAWSVTTLNNFQLALQWHKSVNNKFLKISEIYLDVDVNTRPVADTVAVSNFTVTTRPTVTFNFTNVDGYFQSRYRIYIYTQAQTLVAGFTPGVTAPVYDSGILVGNNTSHTLTSDLQNGVAYQAFALAAVDWPGPQGAQWWSDVTLAGSKSSVFTVAISPPPTPVLTVTNDSTEPGYNIQLGVSVGFNLLTLEQASFEGGTTTGWTALSNCTITNSSAFAVDGAKSMQMASVAAGTMTAEMSLRPAVRAGSTVTIIGTSKAAASARTTRVGARFYDAGGALIGATVFGSPLANNTSTGTQVTFTGVAPALTVSMSIVAEVQATAAGAEQDRWDNFQIAYGTTTSWSPGGYKPSGSVVIERTERVFFSRGPVINWMHPQVYSMGTITGGTNDFTQLRQANDRIRLLPLNIPSPEQPSGISSGMFEWEVNVGPFSYVDIPFSPGTSTDGMNPYLIPVVPGKTMTGGMWMWASSATTARIVMVWITEFNTIVGSAAVSGTANLTASPQLVLASGVAPAGASYARFEIENTSGNNGFRIYGHAPRAYLNSAPETNGWPGQMFSFQTVIVRAMTTSTFADGLDSIIIHDHEYPPGRIVHYRARSFALSAAGLTLASGYSAQVPAYMVPPLRSIIKDPFQPENAVSLFREPAEGETVVEDANEFHALGRDGDPLFSSTWMGGDDGKLTLGYDDYLRLYRMRQLSPARSTLLVQFADGGQKYIRIVDRGLDRIRSYVGTLSLNYVEVKRP